MYPGYMYVFHAPQSDRDWVTFRTVDSNPITEVQDILGKTGTVFRLQLIWEGVEKSYLNLLPPLVPDVMFIHLFQLRSNIIGLLWC